MSEHDKQQPNLVNARPVAAEKPIPEDERIKVGKHGGDAASIVSDARRWCLTCMRNNQPTYGWKTLRATEAGTKCQNCGSTKEAVLIAVVDYPVSTGDPNLGLKDLK